MNERCQARADTPAALRLVRLIQGDKQRNLFAAPPLEEEPTCDPEWHGGKGGNLHELACEAGGALAHERKVHHLPALV